MKIYTDCQLTTLAVPQFTPPAHLPIEWLGEATDGERLAEFAGRLCYMSQANPAKRTTAEYLENIKKQGHGSVLEHANYSLLIEGVSRTFTHELVRHRSGWSYSQLSQRYVDESDVGFVVPPAILALGEASHEYDLWRSNMEEGQMDYTDLSNKLFARYAHITDRTQRRKAAREAARSVLPNSTETKLVATANVRAWRTMLELRANEGAEREIRRFACKALVLFQTLAPAFFSDFEFYVAEVDGEQAARPTYRKV